MFERVLCKAFERHRHKELQTDLLADHYPEIFGCKILERLLVKALASGHKRGWPVLAAGGEVWDRSKLLEALCHIDQSVLTSQLIQITMNLPGISVVSLVFLVVALV